MLPGISAIQEGYMSYKIEEVNSCTRKLVFNFDKLDLTEEIKNALAQKRKTVNLKGFRKGKAPLAMVEKIHGPQIENDALNNFIQTQLFEAVQKEDLRVVGYPALEDMKYEPGKSVSFNAKIEIFPTVELKDYSGYKFSKDKVEISDSDLEEVKKNYLNSKAEMKEVEDEKATLEKGQFAVLNFQGEKEDGERPENMKGEEFVLEIGSNQFIPGFEDGMIGMKKGDKKVIELSFPEEYHAEDLKNANVKFDVELLEIKEKVYPELNDELAKEFGYDSVADFETKNKENLVKQRETAVKQKLHQDILEKLVSENSFDIPGALIAQQEKHIKEDVQKTLTQQGFNESMMKDYFTKWKDDLTTKAIFQVRSGLILDTLAKEFNVETTDADFNAKIEDVAKGAGMDVEQVKSFYEADKNMKTNISYAIREEKTFAALCEKVEVVEK